MSAVIRHLLNQGQPADDGGLTREQAIERLPDALAVFARAMQLMLSPPSALKADALAPDPPALLTVKQAGAILGKSQHWFYTHRDQLPFMRKVGATYRIDHQALLRWMNK